MPPTGLDLVELHLARMDPVCRPNRPALGTSARFRVHVRAGHRGSNREVMLRNERGEGGRPERTDFVFGVSAEREDVGRVGARIGSRFQAVNPSFPRFSESLCAEVATSDQSDRVSGL